MNLPTKITVVRIALIPLMLAVYCLKPIWAWYYILMTAIFVAASCTDFIDGHLARKMNLVTDLGKFLDPIADKILVVAGMLVLLDMGAFPMYFGAIACTLILAREFIIGVFRQIAASKGSVLAADRLGKAKTIVTLIALPVLMLSPIRELNGIAGTAGRWVWYIGLAIFTAAVVLTVWSGAHYIIKNKSVLSETGGK